jgi:hypothetical protein
MDCITKEGRVDKEWHGIEISTYFIFVIYAFGVGLLAFRLKIKIKIK